MFLLSVTWQKLSCDAHLLLSFFAFSSSQIARNYTILSFFIFFFFKFDALSHWHQMVSHKLGRTHLGLYPAKLNGSLTYLHTEETTPNMKMLCYVGDVESVLTQIHALKHRYYFTSKTAVWFIFHITEIFSTLHNYYLLKEGRDYFMQVVSFST